MDWLTQALSALLPDKLVGDNVEVEGDYQDLDIAISGDATIERLVVGELPSGRPYETHDTEDGEEIIIDPENVEDADWNETKPALKAGWEEEEEVSVEFAYPFVSTIRKKISDEYITETLEFYRGVIPHRFLKIVENSLLLTAAIQDVQNISKDEIEFRKRQIAERYGNEAYSLSSLCSAGYLDEGRLFRELYAKKVESGEWDEHDYEDAFVRLVREKPFVVFVSLDQSPREIFDLVRAKIQRLPDYDVEIGFIDIRGISPSNHETIEATIEMLDDHYEDIEFEKDSSTQEMVVRIDVDSVLDVS